MWTNEDDISFSKGKHEVFDKFKAYKALVETQTDMKKTLQFDNGREFVSKKFDDFLCECGVQQQTNAIYTSQQNGGCGMNQ